MTIKQWYLGIGAALAAFIPLSGYADPLPNLVSGASAGDNLNLHFIGVTSENPGTVGSGVNGGSCNAGSCAETTFGAGIINSVVDVTKAGDPTLFTSGAPGALTGLSGNPSGTALAFVIYGIADRSVTPNGINTEIISNTGANTNPFGPGDGSIHLDIYYLPGVDAPCFGSGPNCATPVNAVTSRTGDGKFTGITDVGTLFASFTLEPGVLDGNGVPVPSDVTLTQTFNTTSLNGNGQFFASCVPGPSDPGCTQFQPVTQAQQDSTTGYVSNPADLLLIAQIFDAFETKGASTAVSNNQAAENWLLQIKDPVNAFAAVPEPGSLALLGSALTFFGVAVRRRRRKGSAL